VTRTIVLDDYQDVARRFGPWQRLGSGVTVDAVTEHLTGRPLV
jgi:hypothetical protein